ncbi:MAG: 50S ribosomal protein L9 [Phycisphaerae bacterium]|nr:50S ribosomal protein L9 [Phycisphaerae bacterium]
MSMKVLLRKNVRKLGVIGDVVDVKNGYARNYLIPHGLGVAPTEGNIRRVEEDKARYLAELAKQREELAARARLIEGKEVTISARANEEGHLYGSIGPAQIAAAMSEIGVFLEPGEVQLPNPIRRLDKYDVTLELAEDITAVIHVWVVPVREGGEEGQVTPSAPPAEELPAAPVVEATEE